VRKAGYSLSILLLAYMLAPALEISTPRWTTCDAKFFQEYPGTRLYVADLVYAD
jgi:hypothetical protein